MQDVGLGIAHGVTAAAVEAALQGAAAEGRRVGAVLMVRRCCLPSVCGGTLPTSCIAVQAGKT